MAPLRSFVRDGLRFDVVDGGPSDGETIVLLHGFPGGAPTWAGMRTVLEAAGYRTVALIQRGYSPGARPKAVSSYAVGELVEDVVALADAAGLDRFHVVGHDWGGVVAWQLAAHCPQRLRTATVLSTPHPQALFESLTRSLQSLRSTYTVLWQVPVVAERVLLAGDGGVLRRLLVRSGLCDEIADGYVEAMREPGALTAALAWYRAAGRRPHALRSADITSVPTLYVWSTRDVALGRTAARRTERHVSAPYRYVELDGVSHWIPEEEPTRTAKLVIDHAGHRSA